MALKKYKPTSAGRRFMSTSGFDEVTKSEPERSLTEPLTKTGGRNNRGRITTRHQGGGHKRRYRVIDFKRTKDGVPAKVAAIEYDPNRSARIALSLRRRREELHPRACRPAGRLDRRVGRRADIKAGNALPLEAIPTGTVVHNVELKPGQGGKMARSAGSGVQLVAKDQGYGVLRLPSGEMRRVLLTCRATVGQVGTRARERAERQGRQEPLAGQAPRRPRLRDEPGRPPARRRRGQVEGRPPPGHPAGRADARQAHAPQAQGIRQVDRPRSPPRGERR